MAGSSSAAAAIASSAHVDISPSIAERTSSRNALNRAYLDGVGGSIPSTPVPRKRRTKNKGKEPVGGSASRREQVKRVYSEEHRHSHGLSWSSTTRDSVVDNLLMSLGDLSGSHLDSDMDLDALRERQAEREKYGAPQMPQLPSFPVTRPMQRGRGHTHSSSLSSGLDVHGNAVTPGSPASKYSGSTKGRRSNSSSNFGTVSSRSQTTRRENGPVRVSSDTQRRVGGFSLAKSAGNEIDSNEVGYGSVLEANRLNWGGRRSMSMDQIPSLIGSSVLDRGRPVPSVHSKFDGNYDAAPEPGVPAGPRNKINPMGTGPVFINQAPSKQSLRKVNTQSDLRTASKPCPPIPQYIQDQASDFVRNNSMQGVPSIPHPHEHSAPAPSPGFKGARKDAPSPSRERPGFFKWVFGSASRTPSGLSSDSHDAFVNGDKGLMSDTRSRSQASNDNAPARPETRKTSREQSVPSHPPPALNKKPSSFFRRRKKSNTENMAPPPLPNTGLNLNVKAAQPSPSVSSLRKVMDPYLGHDGTPLQSPHALREDLSRPTTQESKNADSDELSMFHSGYTPPHDASLGLRDPLRRDGTMATKLGHEQQISPRMKIKVKKRQTETAPSATSLPQDLAESSFLHDSSREVSSATLGDHFRAPAEEPKVSPVLETPPAIERRGRHDSRPISRASTGDMILASQPTSPVEARNEVRNFSNGTKVSLDPSDDDDGFIIMHSPSAKAAESLDLKRPERLFLKPTELEETRQNGAEALSPMDTSRNGSMTTALQSPAMHTASSSIAQSQNAPSVYHSTSSLPLPSLQIEGMPRRSGDIQHPRDNSAALVDDSAEYRERARKIYDGDEEDVTKGEAASWLGEGNSLSRKTLQVYMQLFDFGGMNFLSALRMLCERILLRGETQQFDRIVAALTERWCGCNPSHGFKAHDVVHTILYSLILLNTDLHVAVDNDKMSRNAYVKNTIPSLRRLALEAVPNAFDETMKPGLNTARPSLPWAGSGSSAPGAETPGSPSLPPDTPRERTSLDLPRPNASKRLSIRPGMFKSDSDGLTPDSATGGASNTLVNQPWTGNLRGWEAELETVLKSFWTSIRTDPLPLMGSPTLDLTSGDRNLWVASLGGLKRSGSVVSKAPSDNMSFRSKPGFRAITMGWQNRNNRSRPKLYPASTIASSRTSFEDNNSMWSPAQSSSWSKNSFAKTLTSASMNSLGYHLSPTTADYKHSIGFANALSQAIIREEGGAGDNDSVTIPGGLLEDEGLALEGAPWAKEGLVKHKHHLETVDRKAKERSWSDCFAVISKGKLTLFAFGTSNKSHTIGRKNRPKRAGGGRAASLAATKVGGGDWMENAEQLDTFVLRHTIASTLPPPGYSKARPHVWALSLPSGAVHLFQVGTPEIAAEFMSSANYWSARLSKEPLSGSVSNVEYGWSEHVINTALVEHRSESAGSPPSSMASAANARGHLHSVSSASGPLPRPSFQSSLRGSFDTGFGGGGGMGAGRSRLPGDKAHVTEWQPPSQSMMASRLLEVDQLRALTAYVGCAEVELERHNELKHAIELAYSPRHANHHRSVANWQRKSDYLLREIVKFRTYMDSLAAAQTAKERFYAKRSTATGQQHVETASVVSKQPGGASSPVDSGRAMREERDVTPRASVPPPPPVLQQSAAG